MSAVQNIMKRAKELVVQAGNGTLDQTGLNDIAAEIKQLVEAARQSMNGTYAGRYLFSGTATLTAPFPAPALTYAGDANTMQRVIGQGEQVDLNLRGWEAFSVPPTAAGQNVLTAAGQGRDRPPGRQPRGARRARSAGRRRDARPALGEPRHRSARG